MLKSQPIESFVGIRNTVGKRNIANNALSDAVDADLNDSGDILARRGHKLSVAKNIAASYNADDGKAYYVGGGNLCLATLLDGIVRETVIAPSDATEFDDHSGYLFTNDGLQATGGKAVSLVLPPPAIPQITLGAGAMPPGLYAARATNISVASGLMSGTSPIAEFELKTQGGVGVLVPPEPGYVQKVWMTKAAAKRTGGEVFYDSLGASLPGEFVDADPFQVAEHFAYWDSRLCASEYADGHTFVRYSKRNYYHLWDRAGNYVVIPGRVQYMRSIPSALVIATDDAIYATDLVSLTKLADYGCPAGESIVKHPDKDILYIFSKRGICKFYGEFINATEKKCSLPVGAHCSTAIVHQRGIQQFIALHDGGLAFNPF